MTIVEELERRQLQASEQLDACLRRCSAEGLALPVEELMRRENAVFAELLSSNQAP